MKDTLRVHELGEDMVNCVDSICVSSYNFPFMGLVVRGILDKQVRSGIMDTQTEKEVKDAG